MGLRIRRTLLSVIALGAPWACSGADAPGALGTTATALESWAGARFEQVLRVNPGETWVRNRCELTLELGGPARPLTFIATTGSETRAVGWNGSATSNGKLQVSACVGASCQVTATWRAGVDSGSAASCQIVVDDGTERHTGASTGTALTVAGAPTTPVIFNQDAKLHATTTAVAGRCIFRQSASLPDAEVTDLGVFVDGVQQLDLPGPTAIGNVAFPHKLGPVSFGTLYVGTETGATRLKHVTARKEQLHSDNALRCEGTYNSSNGVPVYDVNVSASPIGNGVTIARGATGWTCDVSMFGTGDGCDCGCGILDPDCGSSTCASGCETEHDNGFGQKFYDCQPTGTYDADQALEACAAFTGDVALCVDMGVTCDSNDDVAPDTGVVCGDPDPSGDCVCWGYSGGGAGYAYNDGGGNNCFCPLVGDAAWD